MHEIILPEAKPALEWVNNRVLQKVTPRPEHAFAQNEFGAALGSWARANRKGMAGTEMHFYVQPPREVMRTLVPDVAFISYARWPKEKLKANIIPRVAPDAVVEVRSPDDLQVDIDEKIRVYLAAGTAVVFLVDPDTRTVTALDERGSRTLGDGEILEHTALPGFQLHVSQLFELP